jgi:predicted amidophosphoribosyltransferase
MKHCITCNSDKNHKEFRKNGTQCSLCYKELQSQRDKCRYLQKAEQFKQAVHYTNLQPLWWQDNLAKGAKII